VVLDETSVDIDRSTEPDLGAAKSLTVFVERGRQCRGPSGKRRRVRREIRSLPEAKHVLVLGIESRECSKATPTHGTAPMEDRSTVCNS
jgi:hypothetical protein